MLRTALIVTYHNFSKALEYVQELLITGGLLQVSYEKCPCGLGVEFIYPSIQRPKFILTFRF